MGADAAQRLAEKFSVSPDRARAALLLAQDDILEAARLLEGESPEKAGQVAAWSTAAQAAPAVRPAPAQPRPSGWELVWHVVKGVLLHPMANRLEVDYPGGGGLDIPVLAALALLCVAFWLSVGLVFFGWVLGCRYALRGPEVEFPQVNRVLEKVCALTRRGRKGP